jgi:TPR repeat protein
LKDFYLSFYLKSRCGDRSAFDQLESLYLNGDPVCLGYLMVVLYESDIPLVISKDEARAVSIARHILPNLTMKIDLAIGRVSEDCDQDYDSLSPHEQVILGWLWLTGIGDVRNTTEAAKLLTLAANQGHAQAQYALGWCYKNGAGVDKSTAKAVEWFTSAANQGHAQAKCNIGLCYEYGSGVIKSEEKAAEWYASAANQGLAQAQCSLGLCYKNGIGLRMNEEKAIEWFALAAKQGDSLAEHHLGMCLDFGSTVRWITSAARSRVADLKAKII